MATLDLIKREEAESPDVYRNDLSMSRLVDKSKPDDIYLTQKVTQTPTTFDVYMKEKLNVISDPFWYEEPSILYDPDRVIEFFPTRDMTLNEKLNAISRFLIYLGILMFIAVRNYNLFFIPVIGMAILYIVYYNDAKLHKVNLEQFDENIKKEFQLKPDIPIKIDDVGNICQRPTPNNPFMNVLISDYTDQPTRLPACSQEDDDVKQETEKYFNYNLYKNVEDIWDKRNSQRQYVTMPWTTIPNDRDTFMKWCWKTTMVCKDGAEDACLEFDRVQLGYA